MRLGSAIASLLLGAWSYSDGTQTEPIPQTEHKEVFELVWKRINEKHFDPKFNGVDWKEVHERYLPQVEKVASEAEFYKLLNNMLGELKQSHLAIIPPGHAEHKQGEESSEGGLGEVGVEINFVDKKATILRVEPNSSAAEAGIKPGLILTKINGKAVPEFQSKGEDSHERTGVEYILALRAIQSRLDGDPESSVELEWMNGSQAGKTTLKRRPSSGEIATLGHLAMQTKIEVKTLENGIGYIRFNVFMMNLSQKIQDAIRSFKDAPGIIIDLRNNPGGIGAMCSPIAAMFLAEKTDLGTMRMRDGEIRFPVFPKKNPFKGSLAVLIDQRSASTSEIFAASMQELGRAFVVGSRSAGAVLPSVLEILPNGARLQYVVADFKTPKGVFLEGKGVEPDFSVEVRHKDLLDNRDAVVEKAVLEIMKRK